MRLAVIGSSGFDNYNIMVVVIDELRKIYMIDTIVSGGAKGADTFAEIYAKDNNLKLIVFPAQWDEYGKSAGFIRNTTIWDNSDLGVAFWDGSSKGTAHSFKISKKQQKMLYVFDYNKMNFYLYDDLKTKIHNVSIF